MQRNLVCDHELEAFVQITTLSSSDFQGQSKLAISGRYFQNKTGTHIMLLNTKEINKNLIHINAKNKK